MAKLPESIVDVFMMPAVYGIRIRGQNGNGRDSSIGRDLGSQAKYRNGKTIDFWGRNYSRWIVVVSERINVRENGQW
jgi:hypothetical protein